MSKKTTLISITSFALGAAASAAVFATGSLPIGSASAPKDKEAIEAIIHDYILAHPDVIVDSVKKWQEGESSRQASAAKDTIVKKHDAIFNDKMDAIAGNPSGDITVVEFFDYNCPACKMMFKGLDELVKKDSNVKVVFKEMPIFGDVSNKNSAVGLAVASLASEKYFAFHEGMMAHEGRITPEDAIKIAVALGLKEEDIKKEMAKESITKKIADNHTLANSLGVRGTPALVIGDSLIPSAIAYDALKSAVEAERKK
jgi:protein-disulfide isomerase